jgi:hypothetical protein
MKVQLTLKVDLSLASHLLLLKSQQIPPFQLLTKEPVKPQTKELGMKLLGLTPSLISLMFLL